MIHASTWLQRLLALLPALALLALAGCSPGAPAAPTPTSQATPTPSGPATLKVGLLPIVDSIPFHVAQQNGYFQEAGLRVELVTFASALERDAAMQAGQIDALAADLIAPSLLNKGQDRVRVVKEVTRSYPNGIRISIVAAPGSTVQSPADLRGKRVGISHNTIIEYVLDQLLRDAGVDPASVEKVEVTAIPLRMEMLSQGQIDAAVLPEPLATLATLRGARAIADDGARGLLVGTLVVRKDVLQRSPGAVRALVQAHDRAVAEVNAHAEQYRHLLTEKASLPEVLKDTFPVPRYPQGKVPTRQDVEQAVAWMVQVGMLERPFTYEALVDPSFVPQ